MLRINAASPSAPFDLGRRNTRNLGDDPGYHAMPVPSGAGILVLSDARRLRIVPLSGTAAPEDRLSQSELHPLLDRRLTYLAGKNESKFFAHDEAPKWQFQWTHSHSQDVRKVRNALFTNLRGKPPSQFARRELGGGLE